VAGGDQAEQLLLSPGQEPQGGPAPLHAKRVGDVGLKQDGSATLVIVERAAGPPGEYESASDAERGAGGLARRDPGRVGED
jgi:hypothetical protein